MSKKKKAQKRPNKQELAAQSRKLGYALTKAIGDKLLAVEDGNQEALGAINKGYPDFLVENSD